jgi:Arc/MetJ-type ribon-helix-helix transcriptional regulator
MSKPPPSDPLVRKNVGLPSSLWDAIDAARRTFKGRLPSETETVRILLREALEAREKKAARRAKAEDAT